jgi:AmmeMemoRadiSam system protein B
MSTRYAAMEGRFYPATKQKIFDQIEGMVRENRYPLLDITPDQVFGAVLPHAGHIYSGYQTIPFFQLMSQLEIYPETVVIVHPNHTGLGLPLSIDDADVWSNCVGEVSMDRAFADALDLPLDSRAHAMEHSAEVIIPYLQYYLQDHTFCIVPICMMDQSYSAAASITAKIKEAVRSTGREIMMLASCDFSHFLHPEVGYSKDQQVLDQILSRDTQGVEKAVKKHQVSLCGYGPIMTLMQYASTFGPDYQMKVLARGHSGEVIPSHEVVDYISILFYS